MTRIRNYAPFVGSCAALLLSLVASSTCAPVSGGGPCDTACSDQATIDLRSVTGDWALGAYAIDLNADGVASTCTLPISRAPSRSTSIFGKCTFSTSAAVPELTFGPVSQCGSLTSSDGTAKGGYCLPVPGQFHMTLALGALTLAEMPRHIALTLSRDGMPLGSNMFALTYQQSPVNCCYNASAQWTIAPWGVPNSDAGEDSGDSSAVDANADGPAFADSGVVLCGMTPCDLRVNKCCIGEAGAGTAMCIPAVELCHGPYPSFGCLQATDCPAGQVCCATGDDAGVLRTSCQTVPDGGACSAQLCQTQGECKNGLPCTLQTCVGNASLRLCGVQSGAPFNCQ